MVRACVALVLASLAVAGCATTKINGRPFKAENRRGFKINWTTETDVRDLLGEPTSVITGTDGEDTWVYEYTRLSASENPLPFVHRVTVHQTPHTVLTLGFQYKVLADCAFFTEEYRSEGEEIVPAGSATETCAQ